jgi:GxxExxY protein
LYSEITDQVLKAAVTVHKALGAGFLEKIYVQAVAHELRKAGVAFEMEKRLKVFYDGILLGEYMADTDVEEKVIVEFKCCKALNNDHEAQLLNYLKATGRRVGLLLNFGRRTIEVGRI